MDIIQLRQEDAYKVNDNGDYQIILPQPVILNPNDQLMIKNCFVDTKNINDNEIVLNNDITVEMSYVRCIRNFQIPSASLTYGLNNQGLQTLQDGEIYIQCDESSTTPPLGFVEYTIANFTQSAKIRVKHVIQTYNFTYIDLNNQLATKTVKVDNLWAKDEPMGFVYKQQLKIIAKLGSVQFVDSKKAFEAGFELLPTNPYITAPFNPVNNYKALTLSYTFTIEAGNYTSAQFCDIFSRKTSEVNPTLIDKINNPFLNYTYNVSSGGNPTNVSLPFLRYDGNGIFRQNFGADTSNYLFGSNQVSLLYDDATQSFNLINHFPIYNNDNFGVQFKTIHYYDNTNAQQSVIKPLGNYGCVLFTHLSATDNETGEDIQFFDKVLGFNLDDLLIDIEYKNDDLDGVACTFPYIAGSFGAGLNYSEAFIGANDFVDKSANNAPQPVTEYYKLLAGEYFSINNNYTYINSFKKFNEILINPYYLIEIDVFETDFKNSIDIKHNIAGILSRYYNVGSYTTSGEEASVPMVNNSLIPLTLSTFKIRILNPDGELISDLGSDNTLFLQHIKSDVPNSKK